MNKVVASILLEYRNFWSRHPAALMAVLVIVLYIIVVIAVSLGWQASLWSTIVGGRWESAGSEFPWGTNMIGQNIFARATTSTHTSFMIGSVVTLGTLISSTLTGIAAGMNQGSKLDHVLMWCAAVLDVIPFYLLAVTIAYAFEGVHGGLELALVLAFWSSSMRLIRAEVLRLDTLDFVAAARMSGVNRWQVAYRHLLPNLSPIILIQSTIVFISAIKAEVLISFIGLDSGQRISWGVMLAESTQEVMVGQLNNFLAASGLLTCLVLALNILTDALQERFNPRYLDGRSS